MFAWKHGMGGFYGHGFCMGPDFGRSMSMTWPIPQLDEVEWLKRYKDGRNFIKRMWKRNSKRLKNESKS